MKKNASYILSLLFLTAGLYLANDIRGIEKIFLVGGLIVGALIMRRLIDKLIETMNNP